MSAFDFSEIHNGVRVAFSPNGKLVAAVDKTRLRIQNSDSLAIVGTRTNQDETNELEWSPDSKFVLCAMFKRKQVQIWAVEDEAFSCQIDEGLAGLTHARWAGDSRTVLTASEFQIRLTIWSLEDRKAKYIKFPKFSTKGISQSTSKKYLAVAERREHRDYIGIYSQEFWELIHRFKVDTTDLCDLSWSPDDRVLCCWDNPIDYRFLIYSPRGQMLAKFQAYENALGIKSLSFSPKGRFLAVGSYDQKCRVFNNLTWRSLAEYHHTTPVSVTPQFKKAVVYQEVFSETLSLPEDGDFDDSKSDASGMTSLTTRTNLTVHSNFLRKQVASARVKAKKKQDQKTKYKLGSLPLTIKEQKIVAEENPRVGVGRSLWSPSGKFLATINDNMPNVVWIWNMVRLNLLSVLEHKDKVRTFAWAPPGNGDRLAICCGNDKLYLWSKSGSMIIRCRANKYVVRDLRWRPDGESILLLDKNKFCCCYFPSSDSKQ